MNVILKDSHHLVLIEVWDPVEQGVEVPLIVSVETLAAGVDRHMIMDEFCFLGGHLQKVNQEVFLPSKLC